MKFFVLVAVMMALVAPPATAQVLTNGNFEGTSSGGVATGWTKYVQDGGTINPTVQTALPPEGLRYQQVQVTTASPSVANPQWGGVYQVVTGCVIGSPITIAGQFRTNSANATATVRVDEAGGIVRPVGIFASTNVAAPIWTPFSFDVMPTATSITIFLDAEVRALNKAAAFDALTMTGVPPPDPPLGLNNKAASDPIGSTASVIFNFKVWGKVTIIDPDSFTLDDGSGAPIKVIAYGYGGILDGDYASATGKLSGENPDRVLNALAADVVNLN